MVKKKEKVAVAMSGGVDSSVTAFLLQKKGYDVVGLHMRLGFGNKEAEDAARKVCQKLKIKFYPINLARPFKKTIVDYFLDSYATGITPNPCVNCNRLIKFGELLNRAREIGADYLATGHYIKKSKVKNSLPATASKALQMGKTEVIYKLSKAKDTTKDQSYFLYSLTQKQLAYILFPLGNYTKTEIKKIADKNKLPNIKSESQDICFLPGEHNDFLKENLKMKKGNIILRTSTSVCHHKQNVVGKSVSILIKRGEANDSERGEVIGEHKGLPLYTIGQRRGVELGGKGPYYVSGFDYKKNILYVTGDHDDPSLYSKKFIAKNVNWISDYEPKLPFKCEAVIRYRHKAIACKIIKSKIKDSYLIELTKSQRAITPGQSVVFYKDRDILGGGVIDNY